ncbi:glycoside hydrolase family 95 protein [Colwellia piezophila]|uniref:glycoside hydrolase family 95 protein n=1 Tax=Colwellia piezophila TaxID=211668 RepID=UPI0003797B1C|nr:glycoside hydrolase N-terminal domain-containing protein [Colwellia piezophila]
MKNNKYNNVKSSIKLSVLAVVAVLVSACGDGSKAPESKSALNTSDKSSQQIQASSGQNRLWYKQPATDWMTEALPIGNGYMGAMLFGGINEDRIQFNEQSLWAGGPGASKNYNSGLRKDAHKALPAIRELVTQGKFELAHKLASKELTGHISKEEKNAKGHSFGDFGSFQAFADVYVSQGSTTVPTHYSRALDLETGVATVNYLDGDVNHKREYFANYPSRVMAFHYENDAAVGADYTIRFDSLHPHQVTSENNTLILTGHVADNNMAMEARLEIRIQGGEVSFKDGKANITGAKAMTLLLTAATDYQSQAPKYKGNDYTAFNIKTLTSVTNKDYQNLLTEHVNDYQALYHRVALTLDDGKDSKNADLVKNIPTDQRILNYSKSPSDLGLETLFFQYGRYLLISSSRPGSLPANLQGKWNDSLVPAWASDYHFNINAQMIYWPAEVTNLAETHVPFLEYTQSLVEPGQASAKAFFGVNGWVVNTMNNIFGYTSTGWGFPWGYFPAGAAWVSQHQWQHYDFNGDESFLAQGALPTMEQASLFWLEYLQENAQGQLISIPSYSPEHGGISGGASMDHQIVYNLFTNYLKACQVSSFSCAYTDRVASAKEKLLPPQIGKWGQLQEWAEDLDDPNNKHRHVSHMFAIYPGNQIGRLSTPELAEAAKVSLNARGDGGTGWSLGWKINLWARLADGNRAHKLLQRTMRSVGFKETDSSGVLVNNHGDYDSGVYHNFLSAHPPFQLDGNMGATAGIAEMLLQSHDSAIELLPALPDAWSKGQIKGLRARGGFEIDIAWDKGQLVSANIRKVTQNATGKTVKVKYGEKEITIKDEIGLSVQLDNNLDKQ